PGIHSARFLGETATDEERYLEILKQMKDVPESQRQACFVCSIALAVEGKVLQVFEGRVEGEINREPCGRDGFGYDPIFFLPKFGRTMAELTLQEKNEISHRGRALRQLAIYLEKRGVEERRSAL